jgi:alpha-mannosidase/mannosylglycerate hydrolase
MPETAVQDLPERPIALTLFRSTRRTVFTDGEPEGLLIGHKLAFRYLIVPLSGPIDRAGLCRLGQRLAAGLRNMQLTTKDLRTDGGLSQFSLAENGTVPLRSTLPRRAGFLQVDGPMVVTSLRRVGDGLEVRLFNPNIEAAEATLRVEPQVTGAQRVDFESHPIGEPLPIVDGLLKATLRPKEIVTLRLFDSGPRSE